MSVARCSPPYRLIWRGPDGDRPLRRGEQAALDGVLGFDSALELHGIAYSEFNEVQLISAGRTELVHLPFGACRFVTPPKALVAAGKADYLTMTMDRQGWLSV